MSAEITQESLLAVLRSVAPGLSSAAAATWAAALAPPMQSSGITNPRRVAMAMGMFAEETGGFSVLEENLNYSAAALQTLFGRHFPAADEQAFARQPEKIANRIYANRMGNGDEASGDGWKFRGRGIIQLTGRSLYSQFGSAVGMSLPEVVSYLTTPAGASASACWYWGLPRSPSLLTLSDSWDIEAVTRVVNGGLINLDRRVVMCNAALSAFNNAG